MLAFRFLGEPGGKSRSRCRVEAHAGFSSKSMVFKKPALAHALQSFRDTSMRCRSIYTVLLLLTFCRIGAAFDFEQVRAKAQALAAQPFQPTTNHLPETLLQLSYVEYQALKFNRRKALWRKESLPFQIEFFHPGGSHKQSVAIYEVDDQGVGKITFRSDFFDY